MEIIRTVELMKQYSRQAKLDGNTIGFVATMGYLHTGHMSLVKQARSECDKVVVSVFVNPVQFGPDEDLGKYPRDIKHDEVMLEEFGIDVLFVPDDDQMYPEGYSTYVQVEGLVASVLCGASRPGHFRGVTTVVVKLFNIVDPDISYFGQKDAQQAIIIEKMVKDLNMATKVRVMPVVRDEDGLAMSSRNKYLSSSQRPVSYTHLTLPTKRIV